MKHIAYLTIVASLLGVELLSYNFYDIFQISLFRFAFVCSILVYLAIFLFDSKNEGISSLKEDKYYLRFMIFWWIYALISLIWVYHFEAWSKSVYFIFVGLFLIVFFRKVFKTSMDIVTAFRYFVLIVVFHNIVGWYEMMTRTHLFLDDELATFYNRIGDPISVFFNPNNFATFLMISVFITYICFANARMWYAKLTYLVIITSSVSLLFQTGSRANMIALYMGAIVFLLLINRNRKGWRLFAIITGGLFALFSNLEQIVNFFGFILSNEEMSSSLDRESDWVRINLVKNGFVFLLDTFGFGTGAGNIEYWMKNYAIYDVKKFDNIHNWWMEILTGYGVLIFILYVIFYIKLVRSLLRIYQTSHEKMTQSIALGLLSIMAAFVIGSISASSNFKYEWIWVFWAIVVTFQSLHAPKK
jgi:teichuronic acid biosynthesis protein TuaE